MKSNKSYSYEAGERHAHGWGYTDTRFEFVDERSVMVTGDRYPICGYTMPYLAELQFGWSSWRAGGYKMPCLGMENLHCVQPGTVGS